MHAAIVFPGQGSQFAGMADVWITHDAAREVLDDATDAIGRDIVAGCRDDAEHVPAARQSRAVRRPAGECKCVSAG